MKKYLFAALMSASALAVASDIYLECKTKGYEDIVDVDLADRNFIVSISENGKFIRYVNAHNIPLNTTEDRYVWSKESLPPKTAPKDDPTMVRREEINRVTGQYKMVIFLKDASGVTIGKERLIGRGECSKIDKKL